MATQLTDYTVVGPDGQEYIVSASQNATDEELINFVQSNIGNDNQPTTTKTPTPSKTNVVTGLASGLFDKDEANEDWLGQEGRDEFIALRDNPDVSYADLNNWVRERAKTSGYAAPTEAVIGGPEALIEWRQALAEGAEPAGVEYAPWTQGIVKPIESNLSERVNAENNPKLNLYGDVLRALEQGAQEIGTAGTLARWLNDWTDTGKEQLRKRFPDATDDQLEQLNDELISYVQQGLREANQIETKDDNQVANFLGQMLVPGVEDLIPGHIAGEGLSAALKRIGAAGGINAAADVGYQGIDIAQDVQDEYNPEQTAFAAALGAGFRGTIEGVSAAARSRVNNQLEGSDSIEGPAPIRVPTSRRNTKAYKTELTDSVNDVVDHVNRLTENWTNAPEYEVHPNFKALKGIENDAIGVYGSDGKVKLNTEAILSEAKGRGIDPEDIVSAVTFHEGLGHHGLSQKFGDELDYILTQFYDNSEPDFKAKVEKWKEDNPGAYRGDSRRDILAVEEVLAQLSEKGQMPISLYDRIANMVKNFARDIGLDLKYSTREIESILGMAHSAAINGKGRDVASNGFKYATVYHGSAADFDAFDHTYMGSGEGFQAYGWGSYFTETPKVAERYRDSIGDFEFRWDGEVKTSLDDVRDNVYDLFPNDSESMNLADQIVDYVYLQGKPLDSFRDFAEDMYYPEIRKLGFQTVEETVKPVFDVVKEKFSLKPKGKVYKVELPDDTTWLDWDKPIKDQELARDFLRQGGIQILDYDNWNQLQGTYFLERNLLANLEDRLRWVSRDTPDSPLVKELEQDYARKAEYVEQLKQEYDTTIIETDAGADIYNKLSRSLGSAKAASDFLRDNHIYGNKYLDGISRYKGEENPSYNYVVFDDKVPKITDKYMRPSQFGGGKIDPKDLTVEELFESQNALDLLKRATSDYEPVTMSLDDIKKEAEIRGLTTNDLIKKSGTDLGEVTRKLFMYDIAAEKTGDKLTELFNKIQSGNFTVKDKDNYKKTLAQFQELTSRIFTEQGEVGRALRAVQELTYTRRRVEGIMDVLNNLDDVDDETFYKFARDIQEQIESGKKKTSKLRSGVVNALNLPRAIMSSSDLSAPLRQGIFLISRPEYWKAFPQMFKYFANEKNYRSLMNDITSRKTYPLMVESNLAFSNMETKLSSREEQFMSEWAGKIPLVTRSERAYTGFLNKLRADTFDSMYKSLLKEGVDLSKDKKALKDLGDFISNATGRGSLGSFNSAAPQLSAALFSPRLMASRVNLLNPVYYMKLHPAVRKRAIKSLISFGGIASTVLALGAMGGMDVELDPRSSDFGKLRTGDTRYDIFGGFGQYMTLGSRLSAYISSNAYEALTDEEGIDHYKTTGTGETKKYGTKFGDRTALDAVGQFVSNKFAPVTSFLADYFRGSNAVGEEFNMKDAVINRMTPMFLQDLEETISEYGTGKGAVMAAPGLFGVGVQTFVPSNIDPEAEVDAPESFTMSDLTDGENEYMRAEGGTVTLKKGAKEEWEKRLNENVKELMLQYVMDPRWKELSDKDKAKMIKDIRNEARKITKEEMVEYLNLAEE